MEWWHRNNSVFSWKITQKNWREAAISREMFSLGKPLCGPGIRFPFCSRVFGCKTKLFWLLEGVGSLWTPGEDEKLGFPPRCQSRSPIHEHRHRNPSRTKKKFPIKPQLEKKWEKFDVEPLTILLWLILGNSPQALWDLFHKFCNSLTFPAPVPSWRCSNSQIHQFSSMIPSVLFLPPQQTISEVPGIAPLSNL